jgi:hypothetical protein
MPDPVLVGLGAIGLVAGLLMLARGMLAQRTAARIADIGSSPIGLLAAGEVRITGRAAAAGITLPSPVRDRACVYYRAVASVLEGADDRTVFDEQRGVGFFVKDATGEVRVFPRGATWEVPLDEPTPWAEGRAGVGHSLLLPPAPDEDPLHPDRDDLDFAMRRLVTESGGTREVRYREGRIEPGDTVTIVGRAVPFQDLADPTEVDQAGDVPVTLSGAVDAEHVPDAAALEDPAVAASYAEALEEGTLAASPAEAWGNAAIEGFGIGRPVRQANLDPGAPPAAGPGTPPASARVETASAGSVQRSFEIRPDAVVIAAGPGVPLLIAAGTPTVAAARHEGTFLSGLLGAVLAIASAILLAGALSGTIRL